MTSRIVNHMNVNELLDLGFRLDVDGFAGSELDVRRIVRDARAAGLGSAATDVLADTSAPDVARMRAYAKVSSALARAQRVGAFVIGERRNIA
jgi:hypothetical protein